jgi:thymidylate synthase
MNNLITKNYTEEKIINDYRKIVDNPDYVLMDFDNNLENVLNNGIVSKDRTGVGIKFLPGIKTVVDISKRIPIPTRRKTVWSSMLKEYLWFLTGSDKIDDLNKMGSKIWDYWQDEEWATSQGFDKSSIGYGYGPNLIHFGADLNDLENNKGFNQIDYVINELKTNPSSRRILFTFWRPDTLNKVKLPPCHHTYQFIAEPDENNIFNKLTCVMYQRSSDMFIGNLSTNLQGATFYSYNFN